MKDWAKIAIAQGVELSAQEAERLSHALAELERVFQPLTADLKPDLEPASEFQMEEQ